MDVYDYCRHFDINQHQQLGFLHSVDFHLRDTVRVLEILHIPVFDREGLCR